MLVQVLNPNSCKKVFKEPEDTIVTKGDRKFSAKYRVWVKLQDGRLTYKYWP